MKRLLIIFGLALVFAAAAGATATSMYSGTATQSRVFSARWQTFRQGDFTVTATTAKAPFYWWVIPTDQNGQQNGGAICTSAKSMTTTVTCSLAAAPAGYYRLDVEAIKGKLDVTATVTGETDQ